MTGKLQKLEAVHYNFCSATGKSETCRVGEKNPAGVPVKEIGEHTPMGPGDTWFYDVIYADDSRLRIFNISAVEYGKPMAVQAVKSKLIV